MASSNSTIQKQIKSSSSSSSGSRSVVGLRKKYDYDVFVSFRGPDTRNSFIDYLYASFKRKGIVPFKDNKNVTKGEFIPSKLCSAIEGSQIFIVVFSKNYAFSTWCLRELDQILYHVLVYGKRVLTVFYDVDPSEVRHQKGSYAKAFQKHSKSFKQDLEMVRRWKSALTQLANIAGWDLRHKAQHAEIEKITQEIRISLGDKFSGLPKDLVGIASPLEELKERLLLKANEVRVVGICGLRGVGKSTLANVLYENISHEFEACCVIDDVSKMYKSNGPIGVQKQILRQTLNEEHLQVLNPYEATKLIRSMMRHLKTLVILDNVDQIEKVEKLGVNRECFGAGSRIIIISRNEHVLNEYEVDGVYRVPLLNWANSLQLLFYQKALKCDDITSHYERLARKMLQFTHGLPLAIKVLGSFLSTLHISEWRNALDRLNQRPNKNIIDRVQSKYQYYNGEIQPRSAHHRYVEQRYIEEYPLHMYPSDRGFNPSFLMFNDENTASCSIM